MAGGRSGSTLTQARDQVYRCRCTAICSKTLVGFKDIKHKAYTRHQRDEEILRLRMELETSRRNQRFTAGLSTVPDPSHIVGSHSAQPVHSQLQPAPTGPQAHHTSPHLGPTLLHSPQRSPVPEIPSPHSQNSRTGSFSERDHAEDPSSLRLDSLTSALPDQNSPRSHSSQTVEASESLQEDLEVRLEPGETPDMFERPTYIKEHRSIRMNYLRAARLHIVNHLPVKAANKDLATSLECLWEAGLEPPLEPKPAVTLDTVWRRLGLQVDEFLRRQPVCSECYQRFSFEEITSAQVEKCYKDGCDGTFWRTKLGARYPVRCIVYTRFIAALRRLMIRPSFLKGLALGREAHAEHVEGVLQDACCGSAWLENRSGLERTWRADGRAVDRAVNGGPPEATCSIVSLGYGLLASVNIDWFKMTENYSVGAVYVCFLNLHRSVRYRPENTILACVIPGPGEPSLEELNQVLDPLVEEFRVLYAGVAMKVYEDNLPKVVKVHFSVHMLNADSPARAKATGVAGHAHNKGFCECDCEHCDINTEHGYDIEAHIYRDEDEALRLARNSQQAPNDTERERLAGEYGIRWSSFNHLPQWKPYQCAPIDLMHNLYLGVVKTLWYLLMGAHYFSASQRRNFDKFTDSVEWPSNIGRLPRKLATKGGLRKADEFRRLITILPIALWYVWRNDDDSVPDSAEPIPEDSNYIEDHIRSRQKILDLTILLSAASRLLTSWSITLDDVRHGQTLLQRYCQGLLRLAIHLKPNHHFSMHYERYFRLFGPVYAWWLFAYERFNGMLEKVQINCHPEDYETILARFWTRRHRLHELVEFLPDDASERERAIINDMCESVGNRGTLLAIEAMLARETRYTTGKQAYKPVDLHSIKSVSGLYFLMLDFARTCWPDLELTSDQEPAPGGYPFIYDRVAEVLPFVYRNGLKFGCATAKRTQADKFAFVKFGNSLVPSQIDYLFRLTVGDKEPRLCAVVSPMVADDALPTMPWDEYALELGTFTAYADRFSTFRVVAIEQIIAPMALCRLQARSQTYPHSLMDLWIAILYDRTDTEECDAETEEQEEDESAEIS